MRKLGYEPHALIETLHAVQESFGYLDEVALGWVARSLRIPPSKVYGVSTFYNFFTLKPQGAHTCVVCLGTACYVKHATSILRAIEAYAKIKTWRNDARQAVVAAHRALPGSVRDRAGGRI